MLVTGGYDFHVRTGDRIDIVSPDIIQVAEIDDEQELLRFVAVSHRKVEFCASRNMYLKILGLEQELFDLIVRSGIDPQTMDDTPIEIPVAIGPETWEDRFRRAIRAEIYQAQQQGFETFEDADDFDVPDDDEFVSPYQLTEMQEEAPRHAEAKPRQGGDGSHQEGHKGDKGSGEGGGSGEQGGTPEAGSPSEPGGSGDPGDPEGF